MTEPHARRLPMVLIPSVDVAPVVSIVVVTYATGPIVLDALAAIVANTSIPYEVIVVDNTATAPELAGIDRTPSLLDRHITGATVVVADDNLGFAGGNNLGVEHAVGRYVCLLNPDVIVGPGWLEPLLDALADPSVGVAAPVLVDPDGSLQEAGQLLYDDACTAAVGGPELFSNDWSQAFSRDVDYASAACWLVRRDDFLDLGGLDTRYHPAYFEDVDYALRVEARGQRVRLVVDVPVVHHHGQGGASTDTELGRRSQKVFRSTWTDRIAAQPARPSDGAQALLNRDRLATSSVAWSAAAARSTPGERRRALDDAQSYARRHPRERVAFLTDESVGLDIDAARRAGVDVQVGDVDQLADRREGLVATWNVVGSSSPFDSRAALRSLLSPWTVIVGLAGVILRSLVLRSSWGEMNADEAYTGLASMGVLDGRFPIVVDGNRYSAVIEAYMLAPVTAVVGPSILALKMVPIVWWAIAAILTYLAAAYICADMFDDRRAGRRVGAAAGSFVWLAPGALLVVSTLAYVGYAIGMAVCVAVLITAGHVFDRAAPSVASSALFGALAGLGVYIHPMFLAALLPLTVPVAWHHRRSLRAFWLPFVGAGIVVNVPFLLWNAVNGFPSLDAQNSLPGTYVDRLTTFVQELIPRGYGLRYYTFDWIFGRTFGLLAYGALVAIAMLGCWGMIRRGQRRSRLLIPITIVAVWPLMALFSPLIWSVDGRYNVISFPFVAFAVASGLVMLPVRGRMLSLATASLVVGWAFVYVWPHTDRAIGADRIDGNSGVYQLIDLLDSEGHDEISGSYWRVLTIEYASDREIVGAVSPPGPVRFPERQREVEATPARQVAFVFPSWADEPGRLWMPADQYERIEMANSVVYLPLAEN